MRGACLCHSVLSGCSAAGNKIAVVENLAATQVRRSRSLCVVCTVLIPLASPPLNLRTSSTRSISPTTRLQSSNAWRSSRGFACCCFTTTESTGADTQPPQPSTMPALLLSLLALRSFSDNLGRAFPNLENLALNNNQIVTLKELEPLAALKTLKSLSLIDNQVTKQKGYRSFVIALLPNLRLLDYKKVSAPHGIHCEVHVHTPSTLHVHPPAAHYSKLGISCLLQAKLLVVPCSAPRGPACLLLLSLRSLCEHCQSPATLSMQCMPRLRASPFIAGETG